MAKIPAPKAVKASEMGLGKQATTAKGPFGGGNKYLQLPKLDGFTTPTVKGHSQKVNLKPIKND